MASVPWITLLLLATVSIANHNHRHHTHNRKHHLSTVELDSRECGSEFKVVLNGSKIGKIGKFQAFNWEQITTFENVRLEPNDRRDINVTVSRPPNDEERTFNFSLTAVRLTNKKKVGYADIHFVKHSSEGLRKFATEVVATLLRLHYDYIMLAYRHRRVTCYHPNVAEYFRDYAKDRASMLEQVVTFVHEKQASEFAASECPTDYVTLMETDGFKTQINVDDVTIDVMVDTFTIAYEYETSLGRLLATVYQHAERNGEIELAEFVAADMLPLVTKAINSHKNIIQTVLQGTKEASDRHLREFLFDKRLKK